MLVILLLDMVTEIILDFLNKCSLLTFPYLFLVHTMEELKLTGNHLKGSRPILTFSSNFDKDVHWKLLKEIIIQVSMEIFY